MMTRGVLTVIVDPDGSWKGLSEQIQGTAIAEAGSSQIKASVFGNMSEGDTELFWEHVETQKAAMLKTSVLL